MTSTYDVALGTCVSLSHPGIVTGSSHGSGVVTASCTDLLASSEGSQVIIWNTKQTSTFSYHRTITMANGQTIATLTGSITAGLFSGDPAVLTFTNPATQLLACETPAGLTTKTGITTLLIG